MTEYHDSRARHRAVRPGRDARYPSRGASFDADDVCHLVDASLDFWLTAGRYASHFERAFARRVGRRHALLCNSGSSANLLAVSALTSPLARRAPPAAGRRGHHRRRRLPDHRQPDRPERARAGVRRRRARHVQRRRRRGSPTAVGPRTRAIMLAHTLGNPFDLDAVLRHRRRARPVAGRGLLRRARRDVRRPTGRHVRRPRHRELLPRPPHHDGRGRLRAHRHAADRKRIVESFRDWGRDCWCAPGEDEHLRQALRLAARRAALRLRPQVHLLARRLQPEAHRHAGRGRRRAAGEARRLRRGAPPELVAAARRASSRSRTLLVPARAPTPDSEPSWFGFPLTVRPDAPFTATS